MATINSVSEDVSIADSDFTTASGGGDLFVNTRDTFLLIKNDGVATRTVTVHAPGSCNHGFLHNVVLTVTAGSVYKTRQFPAQRFGGKPQVTYDNAADLKLVAVRAGSYAGS